MNSSSSLPLMEHFYTLQGEGRYTGHPAYFIRLGGCDVGCVWCDVKESWDASKHPLVSIEEITDYVIASGAKIAVITGGEPLMHDLGALTSKLKDKGIRTHIETSGAHPLSGLWDWICLSPKKFKAPLQEVLSVADELKVVVYNKSDFAWAEQHASMVSENCLLYLQPEWSKSDEMTPMIVDHIKNCPSWILSLQTHKFISIP
ncbi:MAG: 7-carboxy-7-deazaguanine synthase QueE [bacterium]|jgi:7-carboxy-7-deazaguanine synthase